MMSKFRFSLAAALLVSFLLCPHLVAAAPITFSFTGTVNQVDVPLEVEFLLGQSVAGSFTLDPSVSDSNLDGMFGLYVGALLGLDVNSGAYAAASSAGGVGITNDFDLGSGPVDSLEVFTTSIAGDPVAGFTPGHVWLTFVDEMGTALGGDTFPESILLGDWTSAYGELRFLPEGEGTMQNVYFTLDSVTPLDTSAVPEPASLLLVGAGAAGLLAWGRRRR
jgi:hypothetical protein